LRFLIVASREEIPKTHPPPRKHIFQMISEIKRLLPCTEPRALR
jgi:hypothetical protein